MKIKLTKPNIKDDNHSNKKAYFNLINMFLPFLLNIFILLGFFNCITLIV